jgi:hypothetical protein
VILIACFWKSELCTSLVKGALSGRQPSNQMTTNQHRAALPVVLIVNVSITLDGAKCRLDLLPTPFRITHLAPLVVIRRDTTQRKACVNGRGTSRYFPPRILSRPSLDHLGRKTPIMVQSQLKSIEKA